MLCFRTNSCVSSFFSQNPGRSWRPPWCSRKEGLRLLKPRPFSPSPRPLLHRRTPPARFHSNHNETMRLLGDPPPLVWTHCGGVVVLSTSFFYFFFLDKFTPFIPLFLPLHRELLQSLDCFKKLNDKNHSRGGKVPTKQKGPDLETCLDFLWEQRIDLIGWNLLQDLLNGPMTRWRDDDEETTCSYLREKKKKETKF